MTTIRTLVVAGSAPARAGLTALLSGADGVCVQGDVTDMGDSLSRMLPGLAPDALVWEIGRDSSGLSRHLDSITRLEHPPALVALGDQPQRDIAVLSAADALPGWAYLSPESDSGAIVAALRAAASGLAALDRSAFDRVVSVQNEAPVGGIDDDILTPRELEVLSLMALGLPNKTIAYRLGISLHTAKFHVAQILGKLDATSRTEAVTQGARRGLVAL